MGDVDVGDLRAVEPFDDLDEDALEALAAASRVRRLPAGATVLAQGAVSDELLVLTSGTVEVLLGFDGLADQKLAEVSAPGLLGEIGVLTGDTRATTVRALGSVTVVAIPASALDGTAADDGVLIGRLAEIATERLRHTQLRHHVSRLFGSADPDTLELAESLMEWVNIPAGQTLFAEGDESDAAWFVVSGRLHAAVGTGGDEVVLGEIGRGEMVGEMGLLDDTPRSASVYAVRDSHLVRLDRAAFALVMERSPKVVMEVARTVLRRVRSGGEPAATRQAIVVVGAGPDVDVDGAARQLFEALGPDRSAILDSAEVDRHLGRDAISQSPDHGVGALRLDYWLGELEETRRFIVLVADRTWSPWTRRAVRAADHVLVVADAAADPTPDGVERSVLEFLADHHHVPTTLVLVHDPSTALPRGTTRWLDRRPGVAHLHMRRDHSGDIARVARLVTGRGVSLVLSGGGARGFAHLGVLRLCEEMAIPVDMVAGTSMGAVMGTGPALGYDARGWEAVAVQRFENLFDYTLPLVAVLRGRRVAEAFESALGDTGIEDLWIPYFCVSSSLTHATEVIHDSGNLAVAVRASTAIPGVLPPVPFGDELLVDGGLLNNLPLDEMRRRNPSGTVLAIDVSPTDAPSLDVGFGLSLSGWRALWDRLDRRRGHDAPPTLPGILVRSTLMASVQNRDRLVREGHADLYVHLPLEDCGLLDFDAVASMADRGEQASRSALEAFAATLDLDA
ncbi:MAG: cyclic nucleotide-binding domain-containing protein [Acidimicrobiales bacterium]